MTQPTFLRRYALICPFLAILYFPMAGLVLGTLLGVPINWNEHLPGVPVNDVIVFPSVNFSNWWQGTFQRDFVRWFENRCPSRIFYLKIFNQVDYSIFRSSYMLENTTLIGPDQQLNLLSYVQDATHQKMKGACDNVPLLIHDLQGIQTQLQKEGKLLLILITPSKPVTYPETISPRFLSYDTSHPRPYDEFIPALQRSGIPFVDGAEIVHGLAKTNPYSLFPKGGVHWNTYAAANVLRPTLEKISEMTHKPVPLPVIESVQWVDASQADLPEADTELAILLNVVWPPVHYPCPKAVLQYQPKPPGTPPHLIFAGGSFCWGFFHVMGLAKADELPAPTFAYYATRLYCAKAGANGISREAYESELAVSDLVVLEINETLPMETVDGMPALVEESGRIKASKENAESH